ncbi:hypothetical protein BJV74DRAFT_866219 [Russula compacta]|nr:hypothetical protein BJV74DRAFT_866219 [Russula compacta]
MAQEEFDNAARRERVPTFKDRPLRAQNKQLRHGSDLYFADSARRKKNLIKVPSVVCLPGSINWEVSNELSPADLGPVPHSGSGESLYLLNLDHRNKINIKMESHHLVKASPLRSSCSCCARKRSFVATSREREPATRRRYASVRNACVS